jgi:hypothetical protein
VWECPTWCESANFEDPSDVARDAQAILQRLVASAALATASAAETNTVVSFRKITEKILPRVH